MFPRVLVLLLVAMNVGVAVWWALSPPPPALPIPAASEPEIAALRLLSEADPERSGLNGDEAETSLPSLPAEPSNAAPRECWQVGPFLTEIDLRRAMNALAPLATRLQFRETREMIRRGYRVFLPSPGSREQALQLARRLSRAGVSDYYVVTAGSEQNTISLGLYRDENNARSRAAEVSALGFEVTIEPRNEELPQYWIDIDVAIGEDWRARLGGYSGVGSQAIDCAMPAASPPLGD